MKNIFIILNILALSYTSAALAEPFKVALVLDRGGKDDRSFNAAAFRGATEAKQKLGIFLKEVEASDDSFFEPALKSFAQKKFDLIIGVGINQAEAVKKIAKEMPQAKFIIVDSPINLPNVKSLLFNEHEGSYLVGAIAAMKTKTNTIGFVGGMDIPLIRRFQMGYEHGAKSIRPDIKVLSNYVGVTSEAWNNPTKGKELGVSQYNRGADIIFVAAGNSGNGVFDAAESKGQFAIGVDSNQNYIKPGRILTSMLKRVDNAVFDAIREASQNKFQTGLKYYGLKDQGIDWALDQYNEKMYSKADLDKINGIKTNIVAGKIKVKDYYKDLHASGP